MNTYAIVEYANGMVTMYQIDNDARAINDAKLQYKRDLKAIIQSDSEIILL